jgi:hypothetical protein
VSVVANHRKLKKKEQEILTFLEEWAKTEGVLEPGEQLVFTLGIRAVPTVQPLTLKNEEFLNLTLAEAFSREKLMQAGCEPRVYVTKIYNSWRSVNGFSAHLTIVREMLERADVVNGIRDGRGWRRKVGTCTAMKVQRVLEFNGVKL